MALYCTRAVLASRRLNARSLFTLSDRCTVTQTVEKLSNFFNSSSIPEPELSSKYLVSHVLGETHAEGYAQYADRVLDPTQRTELDRLASCRLARMPLQYIVGSWDFRDIQLKLRPPVFIPRPETEQLVDIVLESLPVDKPCRVLEVGPGSGNVCLSILHENPNTSVLALERSRMAAELVRENAAHLGLDTRLTVVEERVDDQTVVEANVFNAVVSNPPYILRKDLMNLAPEVSVYEDLRALDGGADGLDVIKPILRLASVGLVPEGKIFLEVDPCHPHLVPPLLPPFNLRLDQVIKDFAGRDRFLVLSRV